MLLMITKVSPLSHSRLKSEDAILYYQRFIVPKMSTMSICSFCSNGLITLDLPVSTSYDVLAFLAVTNMLAVLSLSRFLLSCLVYSWLCYIYIYIYSSLHWWSDVKAEVRQSFVAKGVWLAIVHFSPFKVVARSNEIWHFKPLDVNMLEVKLDMPSWLLREH
jgi:hypothetical protein